jgi:uncharacterized protein YtpQ (UPF0354 family)
MRIPGVAGALADERPSAQMIVPLMKRSEPGDGIRPARQTASFTTDSGQPRTIQLRRSEEFVVEDFVGDLLITYVFDLPRYFRHVNRKDCLDFGIRHDELRALSVQNLVRSRPKPEIKPGRAGVMLVLDENLESSLLLVDHLWDQFEPQLPGETIAAVPARDTILITGTEVPDGIALLERAIDTVWERSEQRLQLSRSVLVRRSKSWHVFDQP